MGSALTRHDFFQMLLPGAIVLFLSDLSLRILAASGGADAIALSEAARTIEQPFVGAAAAFAVGLLLYFLDLPTIAPEYYQGAPSNRLYELLTPSGAQRRAMATYYLSLDELMPNNLADRTLFFGSLYRVGVHTVLLAGGLGALLPSLIWFQEDFSISSVPWGRPDVITCLVFAAITSAIPVVRSLLPQWIHKGALKNRASGWVVGYSVISVTTTIAIWVDVLNKGGRVTESQKVASLLWAVLTVLTWAALRLFGPLDARWRYWQALARDQKGEARRRPDKPFTSESLRLVDATVAVLCVTSLIGLAGDLGRTQTLGVLVVISGGLAVGRVQRHVRRLHGLYGNQVQWLEKNLDRVIEKVVP